MFEQIILKLITSGVIMNLLVHMEELLKCSCPWMRRYQFTLKFSPLVMETFITLILNDHVVHDYTSGIASHITYVLHVLAGCQTIAHQD
jgi:hypothetical protein